MITINSLPAEWHPQQAVLLSWPHLDTDWAYMIDDVTDCYRNLVMALVEFVPVVIIAPDIAVPQQALCNIDCSNIRFVSIPTNDTWIRDYGPISVYNHNNIPCFLDFKFNGWGLKFAADLDNLVTSRLYDSGLFDASYANNLSFVLEGGSIESDGKGTLLTTTDCLSSPNRNGGLAMEYIQMYLSETLGCNHVLWLNHGALEGDDTDGHIDTLARLCPNDIILYVKCYDPTDSHYESLNLMEDDLSSMVTVDGMPYSLVPLPLPDPIYDEDGLRLPATYANFLITNNAVIVPTYNQPHNDSVALSTIADVFPDRQIVGVDCRALIRQHGSLHCATMQIPV